MEAKSFDLERVYDERVSPLMAQIIEICKEHHFPMFATFLYKSDPEGIDDGEDCYCTSNLAFDDHVQSEEMRRLIKTITTRPPSFRLTVKDAEGNTTHEEIVAG